MMSILMLMMIFRWDDVDVEMRRYWWWHWDEMILMMTLKLDDVEDVIEINACCVCILGVQWPVWIFLKKQKGFGLQKIISIPGEGRELFKIFNYSRSMHCWSLCFKLHNCVKIIKTLSLNTCGFSQEKNAGT